jgi:CheY-like chemotaxis protein
MVEQATSSRVRSTQPGKKILVVDDNPDEAELVSALLELQGHDVRSAHSPSEAIAMAAQFQPEVAFLDIGLPAMDGFQLAAALRAMPELRDCRFIAITGYDDADDRKQSKRVGFEAHLVKPIAMETLESVLTATGPSSRRIARKQL